MHRIKNTKKKQKNRGENSTGKGQICLKVLDWTLEKNQAIWSLYDIFQDTVVKAALSKDHLKK